MTYETWMEFNDKIVSSGLFFCAHCKNVLVPPVILTEKNGNICTPCFQSLTQNGEVGSYLENHSLSTLLQDLYFPCKYHNQECSEKLKFEDLKLHEEECAFRTTCCIFSTNCQWKGRRMNLIKHLLEDHRDSILFNENDKYVIETGIQNNSDSLYILRTSIGLLILRIKCELTHKKLYFKVYDSEEKQCSYEVKLKIESRQNRVCFKTMLNVCHDIELLTEFNEAEASEVDLGMLEQSLRTEDSLPLKTEIKVCYKGEDIILERNMLNHMICPKCTMLLRPPIYQCFSGHSICLKCKQQLASCPSCDQTIGDTRNYTLECLANKIRYPCQFESSGCRIKAPIASDHELTCEYQLYSCVLKKCNYKGTYFDLVDHLMARHAFNCYSGKDTVHFKMTLSNRQEMTRICLINYNTIFKMTTRCDLTWGISMISAYSDKSTFIYELVIYDVHESEKKLIKRGTLTKKQVFVFSINEQEICDLIDGDTLNYCFRIVKKF